MLGIETVAVHPADDAACAARAPGRRGGRCRAPVRRPTSTSSDRRRGRRRRAATRVHPGYGFLAERPELRRARAPPPACASSARRRRRWPCSATRPRPARWRASWACRCWPAPTARPSPDEARAPAWPPSDGAVMVKAVAGGGGRGMRPVDPRRRTCPRRCERCAHRGGRGLRRRRALRRAAGAPGPARRGPGRRRRHGRRGHLGDRDCSLQRRRQKLIEIAPAPALPDELRARLSAAAARAGPCGRLPRAWHRRVPGPTEGRRSRFIEVNPRIQVEHTVTEQVTGLDLVEVAAAHRRRRHPRRARPRRSSRHAARRRRAGPGQRRDPAAGRHGCCRATARSPRSSRPPGAASASTPRATRATPSARATTRCWPR